MLCRCPKEVYPHVSTIINICLKYLTCDPNYNYDDEDEDENAMDADGGDDDDQGIFSWFEGEEELVNLHSSEKIDMGGIATKYQCLNDLYNFVFIFCAVFKRSWNKSIGCCWREIIPRENKVQNKYFKILVRWKKAEACRMM